MNLDSEQSEFQPLVNLETNDGDGETPENNPEFQSTPTSRRTRRDSEFLRSHSSGMRNYGSNDTWLAPSSLILAPNAVSPELFLSTGTIGTSDESKSRSVTKKGHSNLRQVNISSSDLPFWVDIFTTFLDLSWRWFFLVILIAYFGSWLVFALIWYTIIYAHGDLDPMNTRNATWEPCIMNMTDFTSTFLFSVETQQTVGYGFYHLTEQCATAVTMLCLQSIFGVILEGLAVGLVVIKMARAKKRTATLLFSKIACICKRDGQLCLMFRVADLRSKSTLLQAHVRAQFVTSRVTEEGEELPISQHELEVGGDGEKGNRLLLLWPTTIIHRINSDSPLYKLSSEDLTSPLCNFEIIVILEGIVESTGLLTQARTSYLPNEIRWGHRFSTIKPTIQLNRRNRYGDHERLLDYSKFHETVLALETPKVSCWQLENMIQNYGKS